MKTYSYPLQSATSTRIRKTNVSLIAAGKTVLQYLLNVLAPSNELQIHQTTNQQGDLIWRVYDPVTERLTYVDSEYDLRVLIEQRYYSNPK